MKLIPPVQISKSNLSDLLSMLDDDEDALAKKKEEREDKEDKKRKKEKKKEEESLNKLQEEKEKKEERQKEKEKEGSVDIDDKDSDDEDEKKKEGSVDNGDKDKDKDVDKDIEEEEEENKKDEKNEEKKEKIIDEPGFVTKILTKLLGDSETKDARTHEIEEILVNPRYPYQSLTSTHQLLFIESSFEYAEEYIGGWVKEYSVQLNQWIDVIVQLVVEKRTEKLMSESPLTEEDLEFIGSTVEENPIIEKTSKMIK
jgi:hypothetical protein